MIVNAVTFALMLAAAALQLPLAREFPPLRPGTATIAGHVVDAITEKPVEDAEVRLIDDASMDDVRATNSLRRQRIGIARTAADGSFAFPKIASGSYHVFVTSKTHLPVCFGVSRQSLGTCAPVSVEDGQRFQDADVFAHPAAIIRGRVVDHDGAPVPRASARITWSGRDERAGFSAVVIDGKFEIGGLQSGTVTLSVEVNGTGGAGMVRAYYPGVLQASEAVPLSIDAGSPTEVEIRVPRIVVGSINAHVSGPQGFRLDKLSLLRPDARSVLPLTREDDGVAHVINLREGRYIIEARGSINGKPLAAFATADVGDGASEVPVDLTEAGSVHGRIVAERGGLPPLGNVRVAAVWMLDGVDVDPVRSDEIVVGSDGAFSFNGLFGFREFQLSGLDRGWEVVSVLAGRTEIAGRGLEITGGSRTELTITVARR